MAACALRICAVLLHLLADGEDFAVLAAIDERGDIWRRRRRWGAQNVFQYPLAADSRRGPIGVGCHHQNTSLPQKSLPVFILQRHAPKMAAVHVWNSVVAGQTFIQERVDRER